MHICSFAFKKFFPGLPSGILMGFQNFTVLSNGLESHGIPILLDIPRDSHGSKKYETSEKMINEKVYILSVRNTALPSVET